MGARREGDEKRGVTWMTEERNTALLAEQANLIWKVGRCCGAAC